MKKEELKGLFKKYADGTCTDQEKALLEAWYLQHNEPGPPVSEGKIRMIKNIIFPQLPGNESRFPRIGVRLAAAAVLIGIMITFVFLLTDTNKTTSNKLQADLPPGTEKATLTLSNGQRINLTDAAQGKISNSAGITITKNKSGQVTFAFAPNAQIDDAPNTITTPAGGQWQVQLADGTLVWLNASSKLVFPTFFAHQKSRMVTLHGEGYFEVAKDSGHPFIVKSANQNVEVLGTHFNINSYQDEQFLKTTLLEGRVKVKSSNGKTAVLRPGEQAVTSNEKIEVKTVDTDEAIAWKEGYFQFDNEPIMSIMRKLSRWYNVEVVYNGPIPTEGINGKVSRNKNISQVIKALEATQTVHLKLEGRRITVMQ